MKCMLFENLLTVSFLLSFLFLFPLPRISFTPYSVILCFPSYLQIRIQTKGDENKRKGNEIQKKCVKFCVTLHSVCSFLILAGI
jgi:hypothetical protein